MAMFDSLRPFYLNNISGPQWSMMDAHQVLKPFFYGCVMEFHGGWVTYHLVHCGPIGWDLQEASVILVGANLY